MDTAVVDTGARFFRGGDAVVRDPYPLFARVREGAPSLRAPALGPVPVVHLTRYADVYVAMRDLRLSSERPLGGVPRRGQSDPSPEDRVALAASERVNTMSMLTKDPPDHTRLRKLVARAFTLRIIGQQWSMI